MGRAPSHKKVRYKAQKSEKSVVCVQQYPECPITPNYGDCHTCPLFGSGNSEPYQEKEKK